MNVDVRGAVVAAENYFKSLKDKISNQVQDLRLEEVELSEDKNFWFVTLGFERPVIQRKKPLSELLPAPALPPDYKYEREYKIFKIDVKTGEVQSMKIRES
jgi:hypothetical protein